MQTQISPSQTVQATGIPSARVDESAPLEAFGGGQSEAGVTSAAGGLANVAGDLAMQQIDKANQVAHLDAVNKAQDAATQLQVQISQMRGKDALAAPDIMNKQWGDTVDKIRSSLQNGTQQAAFDRSTADLYHNLNHTTQTHVAQQMETYDDQTTSSFIANSKTAAVLNADDPDIVSDQLAKQTAVMKDWAGRKGIPVDSDIFKQKLTDTLSSTHTDVIQSQLDAGNTNGADAYFAANKDGMNAADAMKMQKAIESNKDISLGMDIWGEVQTMKLPNGMPNEAAMEKDVMSRDDLSDEKKQRMWTYVKSQARDAILQKNQADQANDRAFMDQAIQGRQKGVALDDALKSVSKFAQDPYDQQVKEAAIQKMYAPPDVTDVKAKYNLWQGIQNGTATKGDIDSAMQKGLINEKDWDSLQQENYKAEIEGRSPEMKATNDRIKQLAESQFGDNKDKTAQFELDVRDASTGKTADEKWQIANDKLKTAPGTGWFGSNWFAQPQFQVDAKTTAANSLAFGQAESDIGPDTVRAIRAGAALKGNNNFSPGDLETFSQSVGGYQNLKPGTPVNTAMQSLMNKGMPVTPANIKAVLGKYPDGKY